MVNVRKRISTSIDRQHQHPTGIVGRVIGARMVRQHAPETVWTIGQLAIAPDDHVLELGFGAGRGIELAARQAVNGQVTGIDLSATMVRAARRGNSRALRAGRVALLRGDATALPFAAEQFDKIFSIHTFYFWPDPLSVMEDIFRVLRPGGMVMLALSTGVIGPGGTREAGPFGTLQRFLEDQLVPGMQRIGFTTAALEQGPDNRQFNTVAALGRKVGKERGYAGETG